jgi:hypothetical protein
MQPVRPKRLPDWSNAQKLLADPSDFLNKMRAFESSALTPPVQRRATARLARHQLDREQVARCSMAATGLFTWAEGIVEMNTVQQQVSLLRSQVTPPSRGAPCVFLPPPSLHTHYASLVFCFFPSFTPSYTYWLPCELGGFGIGCLLDLVSVAWTYGTGETAVVYYAHIYTVPIKQHTLPCNLQPYSMHSNSPVCVISNILSLVSHHVRVYGVCLLCTALCGFSPSVLTPTCPVLAPTAMDESRALPTSSVPAKKSACAGGHAASWAPTA